MVYKNISDIKRNGVYYTPPHLAEFLAKPLVNRADISVFDPAYGDGSLLLAAENIMRRKNSPHKYGRNFYGCDRSPVNGLLKHLPSSNLMEIDFFEYPAERKFDIILMNPPYVRHHLIDDAKRQKYQKIISKQCRLKLSSDLWAYFLIKSTTHLKVGGKIGAILPWSFLQAGYASDVRAWLADNFEKIQVLVLNSEYFDNAQERVVLVWLENYGQTVRSIRMAFSQHISDDVSYFDLNRTNWTSYTVLFSSDFDIESILVKYIERYDFQRFGELATIRIGVVTGADDYFIISPTDAQKYGFSKSQLIPIFTSSKQFSGLFLNGNRPPKNLLRLSLECYKNHKDYIIKGIKERYHLRAHSVRRNPWYSVDVGPTPHAFFPYRATLIPHLILNDRHAQCTNSIHRIYFNNLSQNAIKWIQISLLSVPGQLSLEAYSKIYGNGVLKIEPSSLKKSIVFKSDAAEINSVYTKISEMISLGQKKEAMKIATDFIDNQLDIPIRVSKRAYAALHELQSRRLER
ncbi:MAG: N-6 DNA methylase [Nitrospirota bacterium]